MTTHSEDNVRPARETEDVLRDATALLASAEALSREMFASGVADNFARLPALLGERGKILKKIATLRSEISGFRAAGVPKSQKIQCILEIASKLRENDDTLIEMLQTKKEEARNHLAAAMNAVKLRTYTKRD